MTHGFRRIGRMLWVRSARAADRLGPIVPSGDRIVRLFILRRARCVPVRTRLGSALVAGFLRRGASLASFGLLQLALAESTSLGTHAFSRLSDAMYELELRSGAEGRAVFMGHIGMIATLPLVPCARLGVSRVRCRPWWDSDCWSPASDSSPSRHRGIPR